MHDDASARRRTGIRLVIPARNEADALPAVLAAIPPAVVDEVVVSDNLSTDSTAAVAAACGATVVPSSPAGYGSACLGALAYLALDPPEFVAFMDGDGSDDPAHLPRLLAPLIADEADLVIGSRTLGGAEPGSLTIPQRFGNWLSSFLLARLFGQPTSDLGPFRAIRWTSLAALDMRHPNLGWTVEMQAKAALARLRVIELAVPYHRRRASRSKISGTLRGTFTAGYQILGTLLGLWLKNRRYGRSFSRRQSSEGPKSPRSVSM